jgi:hypothetical protein
MAVSTGSYLQGIHSAVEATGRRAMNSDFALEIVGFESSWLLIKQAPWANLSSGEPVEVPMPMGGATWLGSQAKTNQQGAITLQETETGAADNLLFKLLMNGGKFDAYIYEGTPDRFVRRKQLRGCYLVTEPGDRDWENRSQALIVTGTLFYNYFGEDSQGNVGSLIGAQ